MFPSNLQNSIRELDRQISLLETECENMESENREISLKNSSKILIKESSNRPFITSPCFTSNEFITKRSTISQPDSKSYSASCSQFSKTSRQNSKDGISDSLKKLNDVDPTAARIKEIKYQKSFTKYVGSKTDCSPNDKTYTRPVSSKFGVKQELQSNKKTKNVRDGQSEGTREINSITEVSESNENSDVCPQSRSKKRDLTLKDQIWANHVDPRAWNEKWEESTDEPNECQNVKSHVKKPSSEGGNRPPCSTCFVTERPTVEKRSSDRQTNLTSRNKIYTKKRSRSARTRTSSQYEGTTDGDISKSSKEKEIQCKLFNEEPEKTEFLVDVNNSVKTLQVLIEELKAKSPEERKKTVLNDMQQTLEKISSFKSISGMNNPINTIGCFRGRNLTVLESEESVIDLKKIILGVKLYCEEVSNEKQELMQNIAVRNRTIESFKNNEKEYLALISSLKYNLEKLKEEAEEGARAAKDLKIAQTKLQEETKVIEALKKSHGKMQALIENYVLENDKLRTQLKMAKLESQKFTVLLSGKETEIHRYKTEIESFQKQITEQLNLLRSKASENHAVHTINAIKKQSIFHTEMDSCPSEVTLEKEFNDNSVADSKSLDSASTDARNDSKYREKTLFTVPRVHFETNAESEFSKQSKKPGDCNRDAGFTSCKSDDSETDERKQRSRTRGKKTSPENADEIRVILQDMRKNPSTKMWSVSRNSSNTTQRTTLTNTSDTKESQV